MENKNGFSGFWQGLSNWLHTADLVPVVIIVSTYHYYGALRSHDPVWVALPVAIFVDLLHYRSVSRAVKSRGAWWFGALVTSGMAFGLQFYFYNKGGDLGYWAWLYAALVPAGLAIMAMLSNAQAAETVRNWAEELKAMATARDQALAEAKRATANAQAAEAAKQEAAQAKQEALAMQQEAAEAKQKAAKARQEYIDIQQEAAAALAQGKTMQQEAEAGKRALNYWPHLNERTAAGLRYLAGEFPNMETAAEAAHCHKSTLSKHIAQLNHNG